ncbi:PREDICTED: uncharacterized protein LOC106815850 [Priapulus caudatus]|uniref:Uncharacterized protein LOC106815850 n=1 Tax=Priapulus caudatus TaxID=37621 RepID=A0ABM1EUJ1_PRICU|nr:PREDICTED: uncharacterized protein LOC106815850 [Priapulus caudatus]
MSIPRLELMAAVLSVKLARHITGALDVPMEQCTFWTDSMNALWWIRNRSRAFKPFVANRVSFIQGETNPRQWRHVPTDQNPADLASRGLAVSKLADRDIWWSGPKFLLQDSDFWPKSQFEDIATDCEMKTKHKTCVANMLSHDEKPSGDGDRSVANAEWRLNPTRFSRWLRLKRQTALVLRFIENCRLPKELRRTGPLSPEEISDAEARILRDAQREGFPEESGALAANRPLPTRSSILGLSPKLGDDGIMRMDGRLKYAEFLPYDVRHPIILPRKHWVTQLLVRYYHTLGFHTSGTNHTLADISTRYWITAGREAIRECEKECAKCTLRKSKAGRQIMVPLPGIRLRD